MAASCPMAAPSWCSPIIRVRRSGVARGAYVVVEPAGRRDVTLIATGSEVSLALAAAQTLTSEGIRAAVVSAPCFELFQRQAPAYRRAVLGSAPRVCVEAAIEGGW